jgi:hypothetical protein
MAHTQQLLYAMALAFRGEPADVAVLRYVRCYAPLAPAASTPPLSEAPLPGVPLQAQRMVDTSTVDESHSFTALLLVTASATTAAPSAFSELCRRERCVFSPPADVARAAFPAIAARLPGGDEALLRLVLACASARAPPLAAGAVSAGGALLAACARACACAAARDARAPGIPPAQRAAALTIALQRLSVLCTRPAGTAPGDARAIFEGAIQGSLDCSAAAAELLRAEEPLPLPVGLALHKAANTEYLFSLQALALTA